jgi:DNA-binding FadR family transcriptional regulator
VLNHSKTKRTSRKATNANLLADRIRERIHAEQFRDGDLFMTEAQLAKEFGVSRNSTREAVSRLTALGILEGRKRKGLIVRRPCPIDLLSQSVPMLARSEEDVSELANLRYVVEIGAIELAVANATEEQIHQLDQLARQYELAVRSGAGCEREHEADLALHGLVLQMTGSRLVAGMQDVLAQFFKTAYKDNVYPADEASIWQHHELVAAIRARDLERARSILRSHWHPLLSFPSTSPQNKAPR